ncbi:4-(cytidine 5'-diphospho)-2-C-methyl-D-erythritol kinase [Sulfitobacter guttiformis]|uniref:4-diphosphocytidyl-2-C-methyl-D-erythritol kinase n=1 Tax=Sulfitobacter guttiformis TaxID=74349 RepID=A0A420DQE1_9RHOB|nr:4-(cytidine 5'-diphospho)-2-C-methyl-D-erythritol kinase [Sulfitobacter guttiformis]KIN73749.1 4-diphosphocytidyl-2-C-methyl-D-erythritol kinase [Sulfitobacter guttiformis KCTC 32187]RKE96383.1 4-diphosphocytidyl-2-C-methyl-D-erythritol kinase [Sulfitobacter guttiformis]
MTIEGFAPAKVNLSLHVTGQRADGYHLLDSLVVFASVGDRLWLDKTDTMSMEISGPFANGVPTDARNLVWQAAELAGVKGHIQLEKNLPHGAGLGGGSADAAALLRSLFGQLVDDGIGLEGALSLGADVPVCIGSIPQRMHGIGDLLQAVQPMPRCHIVLVNPSVAVPTGAVFEGLEIKDNPAMDAFDGFEGVAALVGWLQSQRNDLEAPARAVAPVIGQVLDALDDALIARMSGSGSTCYGIYPDSAAADSAAARIRRAYNNWWVVSTQTAGQTPS